VPSGRGDAWSPSGGAIAHGRYQRADHARGGDERGDRAHDAPILGSGTRAQIILAVRWEPIKQTSVSGDRVRLVGFFSRLFIPRSVRRAAHPVRTVKRAATPKPVKQVRRATHPVSNAKYSVERSIATSLRSGRKKGRRAPVYKHGNCLVNHRTPEAAARCRNV
jgi:hypothetical protein